MQDEELKLWLQPDPKSSYIAKCSIFNLNGDLLEEKLQQNFMLLMMATLYYVSDFPLKYAILISLAQS